MSKETLEEAADRLFKTHSNNTSLAEGHYDYMMDKEDFKEASLEIAKWHQERMYSEEDLKQFAFECVANFLSNNDNKVEIKLVDVIIDRVNDKFEQFKKK